MNKTVDVRLNKFPTIPNNLRGKYCLTKKIAENIDICLVSLYHHYYLDNYGFMLSNLNPKNFEYLNFLTDDSDFRFAPKGGLGTSSAAKRNRSFELAQAFCRMFLAQNLGIVYFAHMDKVLNKSTHKGFGGLTIKRKAKAEGKGDVPDYLCARNTTNKIFIGEAKGRYSAINFTNKEFSKWRKQFDRIEVRDGKGNLLSIKGYIVGTRFVTSKNINCKTTIYAEDPKTPGEININEYKHKHKLKTEIIAQHYCNIARKLKLLDLSETLNNFKKKTNDKYKNQVSVWKVIKGPLEGTKLISKATFTHICQYNLLDEKSREMLKSFLIYHTAYDENELKIEIKQNYFFGIHEETFLKIINFSKVWYWEDNSPWKQKDIKYYESSSFLGDGTVIVPFYNLEFLEVKNY